MGSLMWSAVACMRPLLMGYRVFVFIIFTPRTSVMWTNRPVIGRSTANTSAANY